MTAPPLATAPASPVTAPAWRAGLNDRQADVVLHDGDALLVVAGAGTGKTRTLVSRLARLVADGVAPERILLVTFSRRAADEMIRRVGTLTDPAVARAIEAGTFHAVAHRILRRYGTAVGYGDGFTVVDQGDATEVMGLVRNEATVETDRRFARKQTLASIYSRVVNTQVPLRQALDRWYPWCRADRDAIAAVFTAYTERKRAGALVDFDDLLLCWATMAADPVLGPVLSGRFDHVLVDEYQDTNVIQAEILQRTCRPPGGGGPSLTVVGDDAQAVYSFRAATVRNLLDFAGHFPGATRITLDRNYRSPQPVLDLANAVIAGLGEGYRTELWTDRPAGPRPILATCADEVAQSDAVCTTILEHLERGIPLAEQVVLFRSSHHSDLLEVELRRRHLPFVKFGGLRFLEAAHVRDLLAALRLLDNPRDELAWTRLLGLVDGVGPAGARRILADLGVRPRRDAADPITALAGPDRPRAGRRPGSDGDDALGALGTALADCVARTLDVGAQVERLRLVLDPLIRRRYQHPEVRLGDLDALGRLAAGSTSRARLVADLTLDPPVSTGDLAGPPSFDDDCLTLSTVHSAKGGEWPVVHVIHAADGMFPSDLATGDAEGIDGERRLFYVALTRARESLHIYAPLRYHQGRSGSMGDRHGYAPRTRFLPPELDHLLDHRAVRSRHADEGVPVAVAPVTAGIDAWLGGLW